MSFPIIRGTATASSSANVSINATLPTGYQVGDLLVVFAATGSTGVGFTTPTGWTEITLAYAQMRLYWKIADGTEGTFLDIGGLTVKRYATISYAIYDYVSPTFLESAVSFNTANPPSLSPSWGSGNDTLWLTFAGTQRTDNDFQLPVDFSNLIVAESIANNNSTSFASAASARRSVAIATLDPTDMYLSGSMTTQVVATLAIKGSPGISEELATDFVELELLSQLTNAQNKGLTYSVGTEGAITKGIIYTVVAPVIVDKEIVYKVVSPTAIQTTLAYQVSVETPIIKSMKYTVVSPVNQPKQSKYGVITIHTLSTSLKYNVLPRDPYCPDISPYSDMESVYDEMTSPYSPAEKVCTGFENVCG